MNQQSDNQAIERAEFIAREKCPKCTGLGFVDTGSMICCCPDCKGSGIIHWCPSCHGFGTCSGEATGLICGACMGTGIESEEEID